MKVINAVEVHVLCVPSERGLPHAKVQVGRVHPLDGDATLVLHRVQDGVQMAHVPLFYILKRAQTYI